jgi:hypothetical protein
VARQTFRKRIVHHFDKPAYAGDRIEVGLRCLGADLALYQQHEFIENPHPMFSGRTPATGRQIVHIALETVYDYRTCQLTVDVHVYFRTSKKPVIDWTKDISQWKQREDWI